VSSSVGPRKVRRFRASGRGELSAAAHHGDPHRWVLFPVLSEDRCFFSSSEGFPNTMDTSARITRCSSTSLICTCCITQIKYFAIRVQNAYASSASCLRLRSIHVDFPPIVPTLTTSYVHGTSSKALLHDTVAEALQKSVERWPDREAMVFLEDGVRKTYAEFQQDVDRAAAGLLALGLKKGDRLGMWGPNTYEWVLFQFATAKAGIIQNKKKGAGGLGKHQAEAVHGHSNPSTNRAEAVVQRHRHADTRLGLQMQNKQILQLLHMATVSRLHHVVKVKHSRLPAVQEDHRAKLWQSDEGETKQTNGMSFALLTKSLYSNFESLLRGGRLALNYDLCTYVYGTPTMYVDMLNQPDLAKYDLSSIEGGIMAGSPCPPELVKKVVLRMGIKEMTTCGFGASWQEQVQGLLKRVMLVSTLSCIVVGRDLRLLLSSFIGICEGAETFREVRSELTCVTFVSTRRKMRPLFKSFFHLGHERVEAIRKFPLVFWKKKWRTSIMAELFSSLCRLHFWAAPLPAWLPKRLLSIQQAKNTPLHAPRSTLPLFTCDPAPPDLFIGPIQPERKTHAAENIACAIIRTRYAWPTSCKQKHSKNTYIWLLNIHYKDRELLHHSQFAHGGAGIGGQPVPVQVKYSEVLHFVQRPRVQRRQLIPAHVQPAQVLGTREGPWLELSQPVVVKLQNEEVDHGGEEPLGQLAHLVPLHVQVQQTGGLRNLRDLLEPHAVTDDVLQVSVAMARARALALDSQEPQEDAASQQEHAGRRAHSDGLQRPSTSSLQVCRDDLTSSAPQRTHVPTNHNKHQSYFFPCQRLQLNGEENIPAGGKRQVTRYKTGRAGWNIGYGTTENSPVTFLGCPLDNMERKCETVGYILDHVEVHQHAPQINSKKHTDIGSLDAYGYCKIDGRIKDMLIRGGENIYPAEIEQFLHTHPKVKEAQVVGVKDPRMGEEVCACIKLVDGQECTAEEIKAYCRGQIAHYKIPRYILFVTSFPLTVTG
ncbi:hypothetical protein CCH79_00003359, partial [Gambusia affinis]